MLPLFSSSQGFGRASIHPSTHPEGQTVSGFPPGLLESLSFDALGSEELRNHGPRQEVSETCVLLFDTPPGVCSQQLKGQMKVCDAEKERRWGWMESNLPAPVGHLHAGMALYSQLGQSLSEKAHEVWSNH